MEHKKATHWFGLFLSLTLSLFVGACTSSGPDAARGGDGAAGVVVLALSPAEVSSVVVTVSAPDLEAPIVATLVQSGTQWKGLIGAIPAGMGRIFSAAGFNENGGRIFSGESSPVTIVAGQTVSVALTVNPVDAPPPANNAAPVIDSLVVSSVDVAPGAAVHLSLVVHDPNPGDTLTYAWGATGGVFSARTGTQVEWTAPSASGTQRITVHARDPKGAEAMMTVDIHVAVANGSGTADVVVTVNSSPVVTNVTAAPARIDSGETSSLEVIAPDADGDVPSYLWSSDCSGTFSSATSNRPTFTLATVPASKTCTFSVTASDNKPGSLPGTGSITIPVGPPPPVDQPPRITSSFQSSGEAGSEGIVTLSVSAIDPNGTEIDFSWSSSVGSFGEPSTVGGTSEIAWFAPSPFDSPSQIAVTITDGTGQSTVATFEVTPASSPPAPDTTPPTLTALSFPATADATSGDATITVAASATDDGSSLQFGAIVFLSPSMGQSQACVFAGGASPLAATCDLAFRKLGESGVWTVNQVYFYDTSGNGRFVDASELDALGFPTQITVASTPDRTPPAITTFSLTPTTVDATSSDTHVTVTVSATDDLSGIASATIALLSPSGFRVHACGFDGGGATTITATCDLSISSVDPSGTWTIASVQVSDEVGNSKVLLPADLAALGFPGSVEVLSSEDVVAPALTAFSIDPIQVDVGSGPASVSLTASVADERSNIAFGSVIVSSPSGSELHSCSYEGGPRALSATCSIALPATSESGTWTVTQIAFYDVVGNSNYLHAPDLAALGFPTTFEVVANP